MLTLDKTTPRQTNLMWYMKYQILSPLSSFETESFASQKGYRYELSKNLGYIFEESIQWCLKNDTVDKIEPSWDPAAVSCMYSVIEARSISTCSQIWGAALFHITAPVPPFM